MPRLSISTLLFLSCSVEIFSSRLSGAAADELFDSFDTFDSFIINGTYLNGGEDFVALIQIQSDPTNASTPLSICSGSLLARNKVLTAAHCVYDFDTNTTLKPAAINVLVGAYIVGDGTEEPLSSADGTISAVTKVAIPNQWTGGYPDPYDVAVLTLGSNLTSVTPAKLATKGNLPAKGSVVTEIGWGSQAPDGSPNNVTRLAQINRQLNTCTDPITTTFPSGDPTTWCVNEADGGTCIGDGGGPLLANGVILGVTSYGDGPANGCGGFSGFVNVAATEIAAFINAALQA